LWPPHWQEKPRAASSGTGLSARSRARVERLAATLSRHAYDASTKGLLVLAEEPEG